MAALSVQDYKLLVPSACGQDDAQTALILAGAEAAASRYANRTFDTSTEYVEYYNWPAPGTRREIILRNRPVTAVDEVKVDPKGGNGQLADTFGSSTILDEDTDYYFDSAKGTITLLTTRSDWPFSLGVYHGIGVPFSYGSNVRHQRTGTIKVTYTAGYTEVPADVKLAIAMIASWLAGGALEAGGVAVTRYIDVSSSTGAAMDALSYGNSPMLGSARQILGAYRDPVFSRSPW